MKARQGWLVCAVLSLAGCTAPELRTQSPEALDEALESKVKLVGSVARPSGNTYVKAEAVALVTQLAGTGEDPEPSPQRSALMRQMQTLGVNNPNRLLASPTTSLVLVRAFLPPGAQKGDRIDLEVQVPSHSGTTSLRGGWLMQTRLTEMAVLDNTIHEGHPLVIGEGAVLVDPSAEGEKNRGLLVRGKVLGGGVVTKSRSLGLMILPEEKSVRLASQIGLAINKRFSMFKHGIKEGVANPQTDYFINLELHPRYKDNIGRYIRVVRSIAIKETPEELIARTNLLQAQLMDPITCSTAALRLEAIGKEGIKPLMKAVESKDPEVRFYSAEALAYLDVSQAAKPLAASARDEPAFRAYALAALSAMEDVAAYDELRALLDVPSAETRYGAFRALWAMNAKDALVRGESLGGQFSYHLLNTSGPAMIHVTRSFRPEIVLFGPDQRFVTPLVLDAGKLILINAEGGGDEVTVSRFEVGKPDQKRVVSTKVDDVIRAIVELGGTYPDVVQALEQAKSSHSLTSRFEVDAIPESDRSFQRKVEGHDGAETQEQLEVASPLSELFSTRGSKAGR